MQKSNEKRLMYYYITTTSTTTTTVWLICVLLDTQNKSFSCIFFTEIVEGTRTPDAYLWINTLMNTVVYIACNHWLAHLYNDILRSMFVYWSIGGFWLYWFRSLWYNALIGFKAAGPTVDFYNCSTEWIFHTTNDCQPESVSCWVAEMRINRFARL